jgi:hypothetical protein
VLKAPPAIAPDDERKELAAEDVKVAQEEASEGAGVLHGL